MIEGSKWISIKTTMVLKSHENICSQNELHWNNFTKSCGLRGAEALWIAVFMGNFCNVNKNNKKQTNSVLLD